MNLVVDKNSIFPSISKLVGITEKRSPMPILSNILIDFGETSTTIYSTDLELSAIGFLEYRAPEPKRIVIHGKRFIEILREMDNENIHIQIQDNLLILRQKQTEIVLSLQDPNDFPEVQKISGNEHIVVNGATFLEMIEKVSFAISVDDSRHVLTGMHITGKDGRISVVGTDGYRMALYQKVIEGVKTFKGITIPKRSVTEMERIVDEGDEVTIAIDEKHVQISTKNVVVVSRIIEGSFPDYENVIPRSFDGTARLDKELFMRGLKKVSSIIGRSEPIRMNLSKNKLELEAESDIGRAKEVIDVDYSGEEISMNFNVRFVMDVVSHISTNVVLMSAPITYGAVLFLEENNDSYKNIVMPIRV